MSQMSVKLYRKTSCRGLSLFTSHVVRC